MQAPHCFPASQRRTGFTLIELLVVIAIIAVLAGLLVSVAGRVQLQARKTQVTADARNIKLACISFYNDNRQYPLGDVQLAALEYEQEGYHPADTCYGDQPTGLYHTYQLFDVLRAQADADFNVNNHLNPNLNVYWQGQIAKSQTAPRDGITTADYTSPQGHLLKKGSFVDPWGEEYVVYLDVNKDGDLSEALNWYYHDISKNPGTVHPGDGQAVAVASMGVDGQWGTKGNGILKGSDDVVFY